MKKTILLLLIAAFTVSCSEEQRVFEPPFKHELRKFNVNNGRSSSGWYFLVAGSYSSSEQTTVRLYYKAETGEFRFMERPLDEVEIMIEDVKQPYLTNPDAYRITIHCREQDFQPEVNINALK